MLAILEDYHHLSALPRCGFSSFWQAFSVKFSSCLLWCVYGRWLLLSHSSYLLVLLPPPMMISLVHLFGQCGLWYSVHCRIARCRVNLPWSWISLPSLSRNVISMSSHSFCVRLTFLRLFDAMIVPRFMVVFPDVVSCSVCDGFAYCCVLYSLFIVAVFNHFPSFHHQGSCWWMISSISVACWLP